jgi:hypothetical protein
MDLFPREFVLELNTKTLGNTLCFLTITHMTLSTKLVRSYGSLTIDIVVEFCSWTEQRHNRSSIFWLRLAETLEVQHTILDDNSLSFPMIHQAAPNGYRFASYRSWKLDWSLNQHFWQIKPSCIKQSFGKISPWPTQKLWYENIANELSFLLVTHTTHFNIRFGRYGALKVSVPGR